MRITTRLTHRRPLRAACERLCLGLIIKSALKDATCRSNVTIAGYSRVLSSKNPYSGQAGEANAPSQVPIGSIEVRAEGKTVCCYCCCAINGWRRSMGDHCKLLGSRGTRSELPSSRPHPSASASASGKQCKPRIGHRRMSRRLLRRIPFAPILPTKPRPVIAAKPFFQPMRSPRRRQGGQDRLSVKT